MDEVNRTKCNSIANNTEGRLIDRRDGKIYWIAKLKDGLCWMTQNLDYTGYGTAATNFASDTQNTAQYYDPGDYVYTLGSGTSSCSPNINIGLSGCASNVWLNVEGMIPSLNPNQHAALDAIDEDTYLYNAHYLIGNYYNWLAATNGTGTSSVTSGEASGSICPTGWSLPTSNNTNIGSFGGLLSGLSNGTDITIAPYYFVYGGRVNNSLLSGTSGSGHYWSSTVVSGTVAYSLTFANSNVDPSSNGYYRYYGFSVRCVTR